MCTCARDGLGEPPDIRYVLFPTPEALYASCLPLAGPIPESTGTIPRLVRLKMQGNHLTGSMPESMGDLKALEWIRIFGEGRGAQRCCD